MQGLILEGTTEESVRLSDNVELVNDLSPRQVELRYMLQVCADRTLAVFMESTICLPL